MRTTLLACLTAALLTACSNPPAAPPPNEGEKPNATFWQLADDSELDVELKPWPPSGGKVTIEGQLGLGDWHDDKPIFETLEFRVVDKPDSTAPYQKMSRAEQRLEDSLTYTFTAKDVAVPPKTTVWVQFRGTGPRLERPGMLTDWSIKMP